jgi:hypothetical protein
MHDLEFSVVDFRHRFISTLKRRHSDEGEDLIARRNLAAHYGDCKVDNVLYDPPNGRTDYDVFISLYGLHPAILVSSWSASNSVDLS